MQGDGTNTSRETLISISKMDCPSEERLIRLALEGVAGVRGLTFNLQDRTLTVVHACDAKALMAKIEPLGLGASLVKSEERADVEVAPTDDAAEGRVLRLLLGINAAMFIVELTFGVVAQSTGLIADSLDMLADAFVYGVSLYAVGRSVAHKRGAARASGWLQAALATGAVFEVVRRSIYGSEPVEMLMIGVAFVALLANLTCVALLARHRDQGVHMRASWIFSTNDALANLGVMVAGGLVLLTGSPVPDLVVGAVVGLVVMSGAIRILRLSRA